jgi:hypothetical protein
MSDESPSPLIAHRSSLIAVASVVAAVVVLDLYRYADHLIDDTFISLRYARNWVDGYGLVFNPGERVEGYTNFLFVVMAAAFLRLGVDPVLGTKLVSAAAALLTVWTAGRLEALGPPRLARLPVAALLLVPVEAFLYWSVASFETMAFTALLALAVYGLVRESIDDRGHASAVLFALLALTRPEGASLFALSALAAFGIDAHRGRARAVWRRHAVNLVVFACVVGPYLGWRLWYYGDILPNTFHAKVTGGREQILTGLRHAREAALAFPLHAAALVLIVPLWRRVVRAGAHPALAVLPIVAVAHAFYVVGVGGDFMPFFRFFVPLLPFCAVFLAWSLTALDAASGARRRWIGRALPLLVLIAVVASHATEQPYRAFVAHRTTVVGERTGAWLGANLDAGDLIAVNTAGAVPFFAELPTIDMLGLTDAEIASRPIYIVSTGWAGHRKGWGEYVLSRRPRVILWYNSAGSREPFYLGDHELAESALFRFFYRLRAVSLPPTPSSPRAAEERVLARFLGDPFEVSPAAESFSPDLGMRAVLADAPLRRFTTLYDWPVTMTYFELDRRDEELWPGGGRAEVDALLDAATRRWAALPPPPAADSAARAQVDDLCERALRRIEAGDHAQAKEILAQAVERNGKVHSPLVFQYVANLAVLTGDLLVAVGAQKEALRLAPKNDLYRRNLRHLLVVPYKEATKATDGGRTTPGRYPR